MKNKLNTNDIAKLVEHDRVHRRVYTDPAIFDLEMERIWGRAWVFIGHESQVPNPGDYFSTLLGKQPVIMTRHSDGEIRVLFNRCPHKGALLLGENCGHAERIRCAYHGYVFDTDGKLLHVPEQEGYRDTEFCSENPITRIQSVARVQLYRGFVFASLQRTGEDLVSWLGVTKSSFDNAVDRSPLGEIEITGGCLRYLHDANWKILLENISDNMHAPVNHQSSYQTARHFSGDYDPDDMPLAFTILEPFGESYDFFDEVQMTTCGNGHSYSGGELSIHHDYPVDRSYAEALESRHGKARTREILSMSRQNTIIYPSVAIKTAVQIIRIYRPIAVDRTLQETWTYRLKGAPEQMLEDSVFYNQFIFSPTSIAGNDDYEAYHRIQHGLVSQGSDWVSQHRHVNDPEVNRDGTRVVPGTSDLVFRHEFEAWLGYMTAAD